MSDDELSKIIGKPMSKSRVVIERGPVANFATAVCDSNRVYRDPRAAAEAGLRCHPGTSHVPLRHADLGRVRRGAARRQAQGQSHGRGHRSAHGQGRHHPPR